MVDILFCLCKPTCPKVESVLLVLAGCDAQPYRENVLIAPESEFALKCLVVILMILHVMLGIVAILM